MSVHPLKPGYVQPAPEPAPDLMAATGLANGQEAVVNSDYLVKDLLIHGEVSILFGPSNCGKSTFHVDLAASVLFGRPFAGRRTRASAVLCFASEGVRSIRDNTWPHIGGTRGAGAREFFVVDARVDLRNGDHVENVRRHVETLEQLHDCEIGLVIFDTMVLSMGDGDENSSRDMTQLIAGAGHLAKTTHAHVMLVHHAGKDGSFRGSSAIFCNPDTVLEMAPVEAADGRALVRVAQVKQKSVPKGAPILFAVQPFVLGLDDDGDERTTTTIEVLPPDTPLAGKKGAERASKPLGVDERQGAVIAALRGLVAQAKDGAGAAFRAGQIRDNCDPGPFDKVRDTPDNFLKAVGRVLDRLSEMPGGPVIKRDGGYLLTGGNAG